MFRVVSALAVTVASGESADQLMAELQGLEEDIEALMGDSAPVEAPAPAPAPAPPVRRQQATPVHVQEVAQEVADEYDFAAVILEQGQRIKNGWVEDEYGDQLHPVPLKPKPKPPLRVDSTFTDESGCSWTEHQKHDIGHFDIGGAAPNVKSRKAPHAKKMKSCREQCVKLPGCHGFAFYFDGGDGRGVCEFKSELKSKQDQIYESSGHDVWWNDNAKTCKPRTHGSEL